MSNKIIKEKVLKIYNLYKSGVIPKPTEHEVHPNLSKDSRLNYLYFTLPVCLNFQRNSQAMWKSALKTYKDKSTRYLFSPEKVIAKPFEQVQKDLFKHRLALQINKHPKIWYEISQTFSNYYSNDPRVFLTTYNYEVSTILNILQKEKKELFPYLGGQKLSNYWLFILNSFTDAKFNNLSKISIIVDTHVKKASIRLNIVSEDASAKEIEAAWFDLLSSTSINPIDMHPALWCWSRNNFQPSL